MANDLGKKIQARCICGKRHFDVPAPGGRTSIPAGESVDIEILCTDRTCRRLVRHHITSEGVTVSEIGPRAQIGQPERPQLHN